MRRFVGSAKMLYVWYRIKASMVAFSDLMNKG